MNIETLQKFDTEYSADSVEWCPGENYFVCGTYQLVEGQDESTGKHRKGRIYLFEFGEDEKSFSLKDSVETEAILDQKWFSNQLFTATSGGNIKRYELQNEKLLESKPSSVNLNSSETVLALSLDICEESKKILVSDSMGNLSKIDLETMMLEHQWNAHGFEAWTCAFDKFQENVIYSGEKYVQLFNFQLKLQKISGGDDCFLRVFDLRTAGDPSGICKIRAHESGVTSLLSYESDKLITGSYDDTIKLFDTRMMKKSTHTLNLGGGIWRLKLSPINRNLILVACMYKNFSLVDMKFESESFNMGLIATYEEHKSICYGCDWSKRTDEKKFYFATCSFYDHQLHLCRANIV